VGAKSIATAVASTTMNCEKREIQNEKSIFGCTFLPLVLEINQKKCCANGIQSLHISEFAAFIECSNEHKGNGLWNDLLSSVSLLNPPKLTTSTNLVREWTIAHRVHKEQNICVEKVVGIFFLSLL
jgi:hypothetical protein